MHWNLFYKKEEKEEEAKSNTIDIKIDMNITLRGVA
jgi:hypothetical protein